MLSLRDKPGLGRGLLAPLRGVGFALQSGSAFRWSLVPAAMFVGLWGVLLVACGFGSPAIVRALLGWLGMSMPPWLAWLASLVVFILLGLYSLIVALALARASSGFALEALVRLRARALRPDAPTPNGSVSWARSLRVALFPVLVFGPVVVLLSLVSLVVPVLAIVTVPSQILLTAWGLAWDAFDPVFATLAPTMGARDRSRWLWRHFGYVLGLGLGTELSLLVPGVSLFVLPMAVLGATDLVVERQDSLLSPR